MFPGVPLARPMAQALDAALSEARENVEDATTVLETVNFSVKVQSTSSAHTIRISKTRSKGKDAQMILVDFFEPQDNCTLKSSSTAVAI